MCDRAASPYHPYGASGQRGATLIEMAIVMPVLVLLLVGILEVGMAFKDYLTVSFSAREGARAGAFLGNDVNADCDIIKVVVPSLGGGLTHLQRLEIYRADANGQQIPSDTNTYVYTAGDPLDCTNWTATVQWPSTSRQTVAGALPLDILGVRLIVDRSWITGFPPFSGSYTLNETTIVRMEPEAFG